MLNIKIKLNYRPLGMIATKLLAQPFLTSNSLCCTSKKRKLGPLTDIENTLVTRQPKKTPVTVSSCKQ